jgi:hypothetical protein
MQDRKDSQEFKFEFPLIAQYPVGGTTKTSNHGSIIIWGECYENWFHVADVNNVHYELGKDTSFDAYKKWEDVMGNGCIDIVIQQHIEGLLRGDFSYDTTTDQQQDLPDIFNAIANVINPAA